MAQVNGAAADGVHNEVKDYEVLVIGAGLSGISCLYRFRKAGFRTRAFEAGGNFGGVWYWTRYPGARVDSETPFYQLSIPEVYNTWDFSCRFPDHNELRKYCEHVDKILNLSPDVEFNARVNSATYDAEKNKWTIKTERGLVATGKYLVLATGLLHYKHEPDWPGFKNYTGVVHHSSFWQEDTNVKGKKVAVIGTGATGVQIIQELSKEADQLSVFMRRPSYCLPMRQRHFTSDEQNSWRGYYASLFQTARDSRVGFPLSPQTCSIFDVTPEEREAIFERNWKRGAFNFNLGGFPDTALDLKANRIPYEFWAKKVRARMTDKKKAELMAPTEPPFLWGGKRSPLENDFYECLDKPHVEIVDLKSAPIKTFTEKGIITEDDKEREFDVIVLATGFDSFTGSVTNMGLKSKDGIDMKDLWKDGLSTYLGMVMHGFPNAFMVYTPQAPTAHSNGPVIIEAQADFALAAIQKAEKENKKSVEATREAEVQWGEMIEKMNKMTLLQYTNSWWNASNIPGKKSQPMIFVGGINQYEKLCRGKLENWEGFAVG